MPYRLTISEAWDTRVSLGIEFIVQQTSGKVYPIEINPRLTGALPMLSLLHLQAGTIPLEAFHLLEFLDIPYLMDRNALNKRYAETVTGSHLLLFRPPASKTGVAVVKARSLRIQPLEEGISFRKGGQWRYQDIGNENQFILADGPMHVKAGDVTQQDSHDRLCRASLFISGGGPKRHAFPAGPIGGKLGP